MAIGAALLAGYLRARQNPEPFTLACLTARVAEAIVCGALSIGIAGYMEWADPRVTVGLSAGLGLLGTAFITDTIARVAAKRADRA